MKRLGVGIIVAGLVALPFTRPVAAASAPTVSFRFTGVPAGYSILLVGPNTAKGVSASTKKVVLPSSFKRRGDTAYRFSMHLLSADGRYVGPAVFGIQGSSTKWTTNVVAKRSMSLGRIVFKPAGWAKSTQKLSFGQYGKLLKGASRDGKPVGAGRIGVVFKSSVSTMSVRASAAQVCPADLDQSVGGDCDSDGVINAVDVDDDNDGVMDVADKTTAQFPAAGWTPTASIRSRVGGTGSEKTLNANLNTSTLDADINEAIGGEQSSFSLGFFFNLDNQEALSYDAGWVDCGELEYCSASAGTATTGPTSTPLNPFFNEYYCPPENQNSAGGCMEPVFWKDFLGFRVVNGKGSKVEDKGSGITNGMQFSSSGEGTMWAGVMKPRGITDPLAKIKVGDPYLAKMRNAKDGSIKTVPMSLGAFFVTSPAIVKVNDETVDYVADLPLGSRYNPVTVPTSGVLDIWFYRPQRLAIEKSDPTGSKYIDLGGLDYGFSFEADPQINEKVIKSRSIDERLFGCGKVDAYTVSSPISELNGSGGGATLWNLHDSTTDAVPSTDRMVHVVLNLKKCIQAQKSRLYVDSARLSSDPSLELQLQAAGADTTGGRSGSVQSISVSLPTVASTWAPK